MGNHDFLGVIFEQVEHVGRVRRRDDLHRIASFSELLRVAQPVQSVLYIPEESRMDAAIWLLQPDQRRWVRQVSECEDCKSEQRPLGEVRRGDWVTPFAGSQADPTLPVPRRNEQNPVELGQPSRQFRVETLKPFRVGVPQAIQHSRKEVPILREFHARRQLNWARECARVQGVDASPRQSIAQG